jgi:hypothetical protein
MEGAQGSPTRAVRARVPCFRPIDSVAANSVAVNGGDGLRRRRTAGSVRRPGAQSAVITGLLLSSLGTLPFAWAGPGGAFKYIPPGSEMSFRMVPGLGLVQYLTGSFGCESLLECTLEGLV